MAIFDFVEVLFAGIPGGRAYPRGVLGRVDGTLVFYRDVTPKVQLFGCWALEQAIVEDLIRLARKETVEVHYYDTESRTLFVTTPDQMASPGYLQKRNGWQYIVPLRHWATKSLTYTAPVAGRARAMGTKRVLA